MCRSNRSRSNIVVEGMGLSSAATHECESAVQHLFCPWDACTVVTFKKAEAIPWSSHICRSLYTRRKAGLILPSTR
jgi:hypothetical protein